MLAPEALQQFHTEGYLVVKGLFSADESRALTDGFMAMQALGLMP